MFPGVGEGVVGRLSLKSVPASSQTGWNPAYSASLPRKNQASAAA